MPTESVARAFFEKLLLGNRVANIRALVNSDPLTTEDDWFDVKRENPDPKQRDKRSKSIWSEVLGAFANNQGGVIIWGLDARRKEVGGRQIDAITEEVPIDDPEGFKAKLTDWRRQATEPPLPNVEIVPVPLPDDPKKGFVICYIPEGSHKPYRSEDAEKNYYLRSGDNTVVMSRSFLSSLFYPKARAVFRVRAVLQYTQTNRRLAGGLYIAEMSLKVQLENTGTATAKDTTVLVRPVLGTVVSLPVFNAHRLWLLSAVQDRTELRLESVPLHPGQTQDCFTCNWEVREAAPPGGGTTRPICVMPIFEITILCENHSPQVITPQFQLSELFETRETCWSGCSE